MHHTGESVMFTNFDEVSGLTLLYSFALHPWKIKVFGFKIEIRSGALKRLIFKRIGMKSSGMKLPLEGDRVLRCHDKMTKIGFFVRSIDESTSTIEYPELPFAIPLELAQDILYFGDFFLSIYECPPDAQGFREAKKLVQDLKNILCLDKF